MTLLLEYRDKIKQFYRMNSVVILPVLKFLIAFFALNGVNTFMGYMPKLDNLAIVLIASLACSFLPAGFLTMLCALFSLAHMYSLTMEAAAVGLVLYAILFLMLFRFSPKDSYVVVLTTLFLALRIPYVIPIAVGLICGPLSSISVACGVVVYYIFTTVVSCAPTLRTMGKKEILEKVSLLLETLLNDKSMLVTAAAFAVTVIVVYVIRRLAVEHSWTIAMVAGVLTNLVILLIGDLIYSIDFSFGKAFLGSVLAFLIAKIVEFFRFCVDYSRTERVQFEDDEYYYFVKAVPKMNVAAPTKTVKRINTPSHGSYEEYGEEPVRPVSGQSSERNAPARDRRTSRTGSQRPADGFRISSGSGSYGASERSVTTERTARPDASHYGARTGRSVTVGNSAGNRNSGDTDDYEELF